MHKNLFVVVDNTWLSHIILNPFDYGADIVVTSLTKYYSAGKCIAGAIMARCGIYLDIVNHVSPINCQIVLDNIPTMNDRICKSSKITLDVIRSINNIKIYHPAIKDHPSYKKGTKFFKNGLYPSVFAFTLPLPKKDTFIWMNKINDIDKQTSFGSNNTKFDTYPKFLTKNSTLCRLSIGYEDNPKSIIDKLTKAFKNI